MTTRTAAPTAAQIRNAAVSILLAATIPAAKKAPDQLAAGRDELAPRYRSATERAALETGLDSARRRVATTGSIEAALKSLGA